VLPEVVGEMRARAEASSKDLEIRIDQQSQVNLYGDDAGFPGAFWVALLPHQCVIAIEEQQNRNAAFFVSARPDLLRALDEIDKLRAELAAARAALGEASEQATFARLELQEREIAADEIRAFEMPMLGPGDSLRALPILALTPEEREALGRDVRSEWMDWEDLGEADREDYSRVAEHIFLRGLAAGRDLLIAGQLLKRILEDDSLPKADRTLPPGITIAVHRIVSAVERLGERRPDREPPRSAEPATEQEREASDGG
jgi:hypothetical protein